MSMTKEEAIDLLVHGEWIYSLSTGNKEMQELCEAISIVDTALRPITREQVEMMRGKFFQAGIDDVAQDTWRCSRCLAQEFGNIQGINFCPSCGSPLTDEAVDMVMERLEEVLNADTDSV